MARRKNSGLDKARQALLKKSKQALKASQKRAAKKQKQRIHERDLDLVSQWRALNKVGVLQTKKNPSVKNLTDAMRRNVRKAFRDLQGVNHYAGGRLHHPLVREQYKTKSGQKRTRYKVGQFFQFTKTKEKVADYNGGVIKTKKGFIFEKSSPTSKIRVKKGEVIEKAHGVKWSRKAYKGEDILRLYAALKDGSLKVDKNHYLLLMNWGSAAKAYGLDTAERFIKKIDDYAQQMSTDTFQSWLDYTEVHFAQV